LVSFLEVKDCLPACWFLNPLSDSKYSWESIHGYQSRESSNTKFINSYPFLRRIEFLWSKFE
jgi:hypothetical protein